jgi:hypothetical protein
MFDQIPARVPQAEISQSDFNSSQSYMNWEWQSMISGSAENS